MKKLVFRVSSIVLLGLLIITSCELPPRNPPLNSVVTAHGDTDWHIDTAEEFLYGTEMSGATTAANHVPDTWTRRHMHVGMTSTDKYYYDVDLSTSGADTDAAAGIDTAMLFFYAGHGWPESWHTLGSNALPQYMNLGDNPGNGVLRYYWQCSCEVFAHGPRVCSAGGNEYSCPQDFDGSADSAAMRNIYERWGPALTKNLRMACGVSTTAYCHQSQTNAIWDNYNIHGYDVADSFIHGLNVPGIVPLCMTMGGLSAFNTPLVQDHIFTNLPNPAGNRYYHIQFLDDFDTNAPQYQVRIPRRLYVLNVQPPRPPEPVEKLKLVKDGDWLVTQDKVQDRGPTVRVNRISNAVYLRGPYTYDEQVKQLDEGQYIELATRFLREQQWLENKTFLDPTGSRMLISNRAVNEKDQPGKTVQKNVLITFQRTIQDNDVTVPVLGEGGKMTVQMNNDGTVSNASMIWREVVQKGKEVELKTYDEALKEAMEQIKNPNAYKVQNWYWGYLEEAGNVAQTELHIVFQFLFVPISNEQLVDNPPQMVQISGER